MKGGGKSVFIVYANIQDTVRQECLKLGATKIFNKPSYGEELRKCMKESLVKGDTV